MIRQPHVIFCFALLAFAASAAPAQEAAGAKNQTAALNQQAAIGKGIAEAEQRGVEVRIKDIARFRGIRNNQLLGYGLVVGLEGTGDTKNTPFTQTLLANAMKDLGTVVDATQLKVRNVAVVAITAELPPFSSPGNQIDVTVQSIGDAKSLQGGTLLQAPLYAAVSRDVVYAVAQGPISIGGFNASAGGNSVQKNHLNVGRIPSGAIVETSVPTKTVFDGKMYLELDEADLTTSSRIAEKLGSIFPQFQPQPLTAGTIELTLPPGVSPVQAMSEIEMAKVFADVPAVVVINERTGTIVVGGNVRIGPAMIAKGSLNVTIEEFRDVAMPNPFTLARPVPITNNRVDAKEETAQVALIGSAATVADLAKIFHKLRVSPTDIIAILQALQDQGALKARIKVQ
jgi:flagellar P-ring protein precursor FlgI